MKTQSGYKITQDIELITMEGECVILDTARFTVTKVNSAGAYILRAISEHKSLEEIFHFMQMEYGLDADVARDDTVEFLEEIRKVGLVRYE